MTQYNQPKKVNKWRTCQNKLTKNKVHKVQFFLKEECYQSVSKLKLTNAKSEKQTYASKAIYKSKWSVDNGKKERIVL